MEKRSSYRFGIPLGSPPSRARNALLVSNRLVLFLCDYLHTSQERFRFASETQLEINVFVELAFIFLN
jgi:hypothetical protein